MHYIIPIILILLTSCSSHKTVTAQNTTMSNIEENEKKLLTNMTRNFYNNYLNHLESNDNLSLSDYLDLQEEVGHTFQQKISDMIQQAMRNPQYNGGLGGDPIIMGQDYPPAFKYSEPKIINDKATIYVYRDWKTSPIDTTNYIIVKLRKIENSWEIINILEGSQ